MSVYEGLEIYLPQEEGSKFLCLIGCLDAVGSWQIILPMPNLERPY